MRCAECGAEGSYLVTEAGVQSVLCVRCTESVLNVPGFERLAAAFSRPRAECRTCPYCGTKLEDAVKRGLVGCPLCYEAFPESAWEHFGLGEE